MTMTQMPRPRYAGKPAENQELAREEYLRGSVTLESLPTAVTFALTTFCNNRIPCLICDRNVRRRSDDSECSERVIGMMEPLVKTAQVVLLHCGGEAMFSRYFDTFIGTIEPPTRVSFATNAMLMTRGRADLMLERDMMSRIVISMDAATPEVYRVMRPSCKFEVVTENVRYYVERAKALGRTSAEVELNMTLCKTNLLDAPRLTDLAVELGAKSVSYQRLNAGLDYTARTVDGGDWNYVDQSRMDIAASNAAMREAYTRARAGGIRISFVGLPFIEPDAEETKRAAVSTPGAAADAPSRRTEARPRPERTPPCPKPWHEVNVLPDGEVRLCCYHDYPRCSLGSILDGDFMDIWNSPRMVAERQSFLQNGFSTEWCAKSPAVCVNRGRK